MAATGYTVLRVGAAPERGEADLLGCPGYDALKAVVVPLLDGKDLEHVAVIHDGRATDMFVDETGKLDGLPRNDAATDIYRANWMESHPATDPEDLPAIYGTAVVFDRRVWF